VQLFHIAPGETEEQALPILAQKHLGKTSVEMGLDFVGVGGHGNYLPFLRFAEALNIPWLIFSDAEDNIKESVQSQFASSGSIKNESDCIVFLDMGKNFESQLIADGFSSEIKQAIIDQGVYTNDHHKQAKVQEINAYDDDKIYEVITGSKTQYGPAIAEQIIKSDKALPPKMIELIGKIENVFNVQEAGA